MSEGRQELILPLDWEIIDAGNGFTFDMGGSVMKIAFVDKNDYIEPSKREANSKGNLHLVNFSRKELNEGFQFIAKKARIPKSESGEILQVYSTGFGGTQFQKKLMDTVKVKNNQLMELDCFNECFMYVLKNMSQRDIVYPVYKPAFEKIRKKKEHHTKMMLALQGSSEIIDRTIASPNFGKIELVQLEEHDIEKPMIEVDGLFPCGIMMCGTGFGISMVEADGTNRILGTSMRGGKTILGEGFFLTGAKTYEEFMSLCEKGDPLNVSTSNRDLFEGTPSEDECDDDDIYAKLAKFNASEGVPEDVVIYFGKAVDAKTKDEFRREDIARALLETKVADIVQMTVDKAVTNDIKHVFFCGGFVNHPLIREILTYQWLYHFHFQAKYNEKKTEPHIHFLIHGQSMGAIGALLNHKFKWSARNKAKMEK